MHSRNYHRSSFGRVMQSGKSENDLSQIFGNIAPKEWKKYNSKKKKKDNKDTKTHKCKIEKKEYQCQNPFHFLIKHCDLSRKLPTPCSCSQIRKIRKPARFLDLRTSFSYKCDDNTEAFATREDLVRGEHDRGKKPSQHDRAMLNLTDSTT